MAPEGENLRDHLAAKYGTTPEESRRARARLTEMGAELGFTFNYADDMRMYNTFGAHQLIHWTGQFGKSHQMKMALFEAFFSDRANVSDPNVLADRAATIGLDGTAALNALEKEIVAQEVRRAEQFWIAQGIQGVPAMIFDRKHLITGAQGTERYQLILREVLAARAA